MSRPENINSTFFAGSYKEVWRKIIPAGLTEAEVTFIEDVANITKGSHVLDVMCGYGRHALELARRGCNVTAIDNLEEYVREIAETATEHNLPVQAVLSDALKAELTATYDAAICMGNSFSFFNTQDATTLLNKLAGHLKDGAKLIINSWMIGEIAIRHFKDKDWYYVGQYKCVLDNKYLLHPTRIETEQFIYNEAGEVECNKGVDYILTIAELETLLQAAGFTLRAVYSTPRKKPFQLGDTRAYMVAEKH